MTTNSLVKTEQATLSVRDAASVWFRHKLLITITFLAIAIGTAIGTSLLANQYESRAKILVKNMRTDVPVTPERTNGATGVASDGEVSETMINSEIELLTSKDLLNQVASECGLDKQPPSLLERLGLKEAPRTEAARVEQAAERLSKDLVISPVKKANIIEITYTSSSPETAVAVLRKLQTLYMEKHLKLNRPPGTYEFFKTQADQYAQQLREAENQLSTFQQGNVISLSQQKDLAVQKMTESRSKLLETDAFLKEVNERIELLQQQLRTLQPRIVTQSKLLPNQYSAERLNTMLVELQNRRTQLLTKFRPEDRLVREVNEQIRTTKAALEKARKETATEQATDLNPLRQTIETELARAKVDQAGAQARHASLAAQLQQYENQLSRFEGVTAEYDDLTRRVKEAEGNYQLYAKKQEEARIADQLDQNKITNVSVAEAPAQPHLPARPNRPLNLILGIFVGALVSIGSAVLAEFFRENVYTPRELEALSGSPVLATVPLDRWARRSLIVDKRKLSLPEGEPDLEPDFASGD